MMAAPGHTVPASSKKIICVLCPGGVDHSGGIGRWAGYLRDAWAIREEELALRILDTRGRHHIIFAPLFFAAALATLVRLRLTGRLALIHANLSTRGSTVRKGIVAWFAAALGVPLVVHLHGSDFDGFYRGLPRFGQRFVQRIFARATRVIVLGEVWRRFLRDEVGVPGEKIDILYNAVPAPPPAKRSPASAICRILFLGRLGARKGIPELLDALASPELRRRPWQALLAGDGEVAEFARRAAELALGDRVAFPGWIDAASCAGHLGEADIFVLPSHSENLPLAVVEALAQGVAVVATPVGALPELLTNDRSAVLIPIGERATLAATLVRLIDDPELRRRIAAGGFRVFAEHLEIGAAAERLSWLYGEVVATHGRRAALQPPKGTAELG